MATGDVDVLAPRELILPVARYVAGASLPHGMVFISAGALCVVSGAAVYRIEMRGTALSGGLFA